MHHRLPIVTNLLRGVVVSENGLGMGVYQAAHWVEQLGYRLTLISNQAGKGVLRVVGVTDKLTGIQVLIQMCLAIRASIYSPISSPG